MIDKKLHNRINQFKDDLSKLFIKYGDLNPDIQCTVIQYVILCGFQEALEEGRINFEGCRKALNHCIDEAINSLIFTHALKREDEK
jgi:hypothetical protein